MIIQTNKNIVARKVHDSYFLIDITDNYTSDKCVLFQIDEIGYFIWNNINGKNTSNDLAKLLKSSVSDDIMYQTILCDVIEFLCELNKKGLIYKED